METAAVSYETLVSLGCSGKLREVDAQHLHACGQTSQMVDEQGAAQDSRVSVKDGLKSLHFEQQQIQQTAQALCSRSSFG